MITYAEDIKALEKLNPAKENFDICISVISEEPHAEWVGDSIDMKLEEAEDSILKASFATGIPVVMVSLLGRPQNIKWAVENIPAILWAYLPGTEGAEPIADVLFGDHNPSGRLPVTFPRDAAQIPIVYNARRYESDDISTAYDPLFPFGYGLSYTKFEYYDLQIPNTVRAGKNIEVTIMVKNVGKLDGCEVVQLYLKDMYASVTRPLKSLKAFDKIFLHAGEKKKVTFLLGPDELSFLDENLISVVEPREVEILIGSQSRIFEIV
jgi:beta-glucosidase